jgi:serine protease AprX
MEATARDLGPPGKDNDFGAGLLDAYAAVKRAASGR